MDADEFRKAARGVIEDIISYNETLPSRRVLPEVSPGYLRPLIPSNAPEKHESWSSIHADIDRVIQPGLTHWQSPYFMAFFPSLTSYPSQLGEMYSAAFQAAAFNWLCSPACTELETVMMDWVGRALHLPSCFLADESHGAGGGVIQGTASEAVATAMIAARERYLLQRTAQIEDPKARQDEIDRLRGKLVALGSEHAHSSTHKSANVAGVRHRAVPTFASDGYAMKGKHLLATLNELVADGLEPFYLTITLGTTATCAIDDLSGIAAVLNDWPRGRIWSHVDAAYAGSALMLPQYRHLSALLAPFDSFNMNLHKWTLINFDASPLFVRSRHDLTAALTISPSYLENSYTASGLVTDYRDWGIPFGRRFRSLKIWFVFRSYGLEGLRAHIEQGVARGEQFADLIKTRPDVLKIVTGPSFGLTVISVVPPASPSPGAKDAGPIAAVGEGVGDMPAAVNGRAKSKEAGAGGEALEAANRVTKEVYDRIFKEGKFYVISGVVAGAFVIRIVACNPTTTEGHIREIFEKLASTAEEVVGGK